VGIVAFLSGSLNGYPTWNERDTINVLAFFAVPTELYFMAAVFDKLGIRFLYPENWTVETDDTAPGRQTISVYSPGGAFWTVMLHSQDKDPVELARTALVAMQDEYDELDSEFAREEIEGVELIGFDLNFYCLDLTNTAWIRAGSSESSVLLMICQAEDREFEEISPIFQAMTASLLAMRNGQSGKD
jgi:hypothetical protein